MNPTLPGLLEPDSAITAIYQEILDEHGALQRHYYDQHIDHLVRQFLIASGLVREEEIREMIEVFPTTAHLVTPTHVFRFFWRIGWFTAVDPRWVLEVDTLLNRRDQFAPGINWGILSDGKRWVRRRPGQTSDPPDPEEIFEICDAGDWPRLRRWLQAQIHSSSEPLVPDRG